MIKHIAPPIAAFAGLAIRGAWDHDTTLVWMGMGAVVVMLALGIIFERPPS